MQRQVPASTSTTAGIREKNRLVFNPWSKNGVTPSYVKGVPLIGEFNVHETDKK